jgi:hypothetical protein
MIRQPIELGVARRLSVDAARSQRGESGRQPLSEEESTVATAIWIIVIVALLVFAAWAVTRSRAAGRR